MKYAKFIELVDGRLINDRSVDPKTVAVSWEHFKLVKAGSERINYHCDFKNGKCFVQYHYAHDDSDTSIKEKMCYCISCFNAIGHFRYLQKNDKKQLELLARKYIKPKDPEKLVASGFWRVGKGCVLPRMYRSAICLRYACNTSAMAEIDLFYLYHILNFYDYGRMENKLIKFMAEKDNNQPLLLDEMSPSQREFAIDILWKFVEQEFDKYKKRIELTKGERIKRKKRRHATKTT